MSTADVSAQDETLPMVARNVDIADDLVISDPANHTGPYPEIDILEVSTTEEAGSVVFSMRLKADPVVDNVSYVYRWDVCLYDLDPHPDSCDDFVVTFSNGSAASRQGPTHESASIRQSTDGRLEVVVPASSIQHFDNWWRLSAIAQADSFRDSRTDVASLDPEYGYILFDKDISLDEARFGSPTVAIETLEILGLGDHFRLEAVGTTTGDVQDLMVSLGSLWWFGISDEPSWGWSSWWLEQNLTAKDNRTSLEKVGDTWARWRFVHDYSPQDYRAGWIVGSKLEVRAIAADGAWGHASRFCDCGNSTGPIPDPGTNGQGGGFISGTAAPAAVSALAAVALGLASRRRRDRW